MRFYLDKHIISCININMGTDSVKPKEPVKINIVREKFLGAKDSKDLISAVKVVSEYSFLYGGENQKISFTAFFRIKDKINFDEFKKIDHQEFNNYTESILWTLETSFIRDLIDKFGIEFSKNIPLGVELNV